MALTISDVESIAHLARLHVSDDEIVDYIEKLSSIIDLVADLGKLDTTDVVPMAHPLDMSQRLRADAVTEEVQRDLLQENSTAVQEGLYTVPQVIE